MNKLLYCCYSPNLKEYLLKNNCRYEICAKNPNSNKIFWVYIRDRQLNDLLTRWTDKW